MSLCDEYFSKKGEESFPGDEGHDHIPEQSDEVGEQDLVLHRHEPEINGRCQRPDLPVVDHHLLILILAGLDSLLPGLDIAVCHDLVNREEECHKDRREDQLVDRHRAELARHERVGDDGEVRDQHRRIEDQQGEDCGEGAEDDAGGDPADGITNSTGDGWNDDGKW